MGGAEFLYAQASTFPLEGFVGIPRIYNTGVRSLSLGEAGVADPSHYTSFTDNPALLSFASHKSSINISGYQNWENNILEYGLTPPAFSLGSLTGVFRFGYFHTGLSEINPIDNSIIAEPNLEMYQMDAGYSLAINSVFSIGVLHNLTYANNETAQYWTYSANSGFFYDPIGPTSYGIVVRGLGRSVKYSFIEDGTTILGSHNIPISVDLGASIRFPKDKEESVFILSLSNLKRFGESGIWYKGGMEVKPLTYLALRSGVMFHPEYQEYIPRFGIGFDTRRFIIDYGASPILYDHERFHQIGLTIHF